MRAWLLFLTPLLFAADPQVVRLYDGPAPGSESWDWKETETVGPNDTVRRIGNVVTPTLTVYLPPAGTATGTGVVICPGGGFRILAIDKEGIDVARWLNTLGVAAFVLKYRVMRTDVPAANPLESRAQVIPLSVADGKRALALVRSRAAEWGVKPGRLGIMGFSAGGYVAAAGAMSEAKPDFAAPIYAGVPPQITVPAGAPPMFLVHATDDRTVNVAESTVRLFTAWKNAGVPVEMHVYAQGGHGFGMTKQNKPVDTWTARLAEWMGTLGLLR